MHKAIRAYLQGALGDATFNRLHKTHRFSQKDREWLLLLKDLFAKLGYKAWIYKEGKARHLYVLETTAKFLNLRFDPSQLRSEEAVAYVRGYFDAEGGIPQSLNSRFYVQFCQKNEFSLQRVKFILEELKIECGKIHNPSKRIDSHYWRFFVKANSYGNFIKKINSWHPRKKNLLLQRMKI